MVGGTRVGEMGWGGRGGARLRGEGLGLGREGGGRLMRETEEQQGGVWQVARGWGEECGSTPCSDPQRHTQCANFRGTHVRAHLRIAALSL